MTMSTTILRKRRIITFAVVWWGYALTYFLRKPLGVLKSALSSDLGLNAQQLGWLDAALLAPYALAQLGLAPLAQRLGARRTLAAGLLASGAAMMTFGLWGGAPVLAVLLALNGGAQALCWPACSRALADWYPAGASSARNSVFGAFGTSAFAGGVMGTALAVYLQAQFGWRLVHLLPSLVCMCFGMLVLLALRSPEELGVVIPGDVQDAATGGSAPVALGWRQVWSIPTVPEMAVSLLFVKLVRYAMYMWLPLYLSAVLRYGPREAGLYSLAFDLGAAAGSAFIGAAVDRLSAGRPLTGCLLSTVCCTLSLLAFSWAASWGRLACLSLLLLAGLFNGGPDTLLSGSIPTEVGQPHRAAQAVCATVNGLGSVGTFLEGPLLGAVSLHYGWSAVFYVVVAASLISAACVLRASVVSRTQTPKYVALPTGQGQA